MTTKKYAIMAECGVLYLCKEATFNMAVRMADTKPNLCVWTPFYWNAIHFETAQEAVVHAHSEQGTKADVIIVDITEKQHDQHR